MIKNNLNIISKENKLMFNVFEIFSIISFFSCLIFVNNKEKILLMLLPLGFAIINLFFYKNYIYKKENIIVLLIESLFFVRLSLLPFLYSFNSDIQLFEGNKNVSPFFNKSCLLMLYEFLIIQIIIFLHKKSNKRKIFSINLKENMSKLFIILISIYIFTICFFMPQYASKFKTIFSLSDQNFTSARLNKIYEIGSLGRILKTLFLLFFQLFRILLPIYIIRKISKNSQNSKLIYVVLIMSCVLQFLFLTDTFAESIVSCLVIILYYLHLFPNKRKKVFLFATICTVGIMIIYFSVRYFVTSTGMYKKSDNPIVYMARIINAYFTGVDDVAAIFNVKKSFKFETIKAGILGAIPFNSTLFKEKGKKLQYYYNDFNNSYGQIPPTIGAGYYYFGVILSPIISAIFIKLSLIYYDKAEKNEKSIKYAPEIFCSIVFALGTVMYSPSITLSWFLGWGIPMLLITSNTGEQ